MRLTPLCRLGLTAANAAKKPKSDFVLVDCKSFVTDFSIQRVRPRMGDKLEFMCWDPLVQQEVLFKESKKVRTLPAVRPHHPGWDRLQIVHDPEDPVGQTKEWYRLPDSEGRSWGKPDKDRYNYFRSDLPPPNW